MPNKSSPHGGAVVEGSISTGTLRTQDLLRAFADEFERLLPFNSANLVAEARECADRFDTDDPDDFGESNDILDELNDNLNIIAAREGFYFGSLEGDGADFGFWRNEPDECEGSQ